MICLHWLFDFWLSNLSNLCFVDKEMRTQMKEKFEKYKGGPEKKNE